MAGAEENLGWCTDFGGLSWLTLTWADIGGLVTGVTGVTGVRLRSEAATELTRGWDTGARLLRLGYSVTSEV